MKTFIFKGVRALSFLVMAWLWIASLETTPQSGMPLQVATTIGICIVAIQFIASFFKEWVKLDE